jgi:RND family efflux transporter MFP subunit
MVKLFKSKKFIIVISVLGVLALGIYILVSNSRIIPVKEVVPAEMPLSKTVAASGRVVSRSEVNLSFINGGLITSLDVAKGDKVYKGQLLGTTDTTVLESNVQAARDARDITLRNRDLFLQQYQNKPSLVGGQKQYDIQLRTINEQISQAEAGLDAALATLSKSNLYSPIDATVIDVLGHYGEVAAPGAPVVRIANTDAFHFEIQLDQEDITSVRVGQAAMLQLDAYQDKEITAYVTDISPFASPTGNFTVKMSIEKSSDLVILIGMTGDAYIEVESTEGDVEALSFDEVYTDDEGNKFVWVLNESNRLEKRYIEVGLEGDIFYEIRGPLEGRIVVPASPNGKVIEEGMKAKLVK